jgi:4'-phosphopantetheinyl transferase
MALSARLPVAPPKGRVVHVWSMRHTSHADQDALRAMLSNEERAVAARFKAADRAASYVFYRATVRQCLACYLNAAPQQVKLERSATGKPMWLDTVDGHRLAISITHRDERGLLAVAALEAVGIDLECVDPKANYDAIARQASSEEELRHYEQAERAARPPLLLRTWTAKEAVLKASGEGLGRPLGELEVRWLEPSAEGIAGCEAAQRRWNLVTWSPETDWFAAVAAPEGREPIALEHFEASAFMEVDRSHVE